MTQSSHELVKAFFAAMPAGTLTTDFFASEIETRSITSQPQHSAEFYVGGIKLLQSQFPEGLYYTVESIAAEEDRAAARVTGRGTMKDGREYRNDYCFWFTFKDGRIATIFEFFNPKPVDDLIMPALSAFFAQQAKP
jgi:ketosteroid isomerase-like protein